MSSKWPDALRDALSLRLALWYFLLFAASSAILLGLTYLLLARSLQAQDRDLVAAMLDRYATQYAAGGLGALDQAIAADRLEGRHEQLLVRVVGRQAVATYFNLPAGWSQFDLSPLDQPSRERSWWQTIRARGAETTLEVATVRLADGTLVQVGRSSQVRESLLSNFRERSLAVLALIFLIAIAGGAILTSIGLAPVRAMETTLRSIVHTGRIDQRVAARGTHDALDDLAVLVNSMLERLERLVGGMRGALDNVAHDLRTPLTRLRNVAEQALAASDPDTMREGLAQVVDETERLGATLTALMDISGAESGTLALDRHPIALAAVTREAVDLYEDAAEAKGLTLAVEPIDPGLDVMADRTRLRQVLANLLDNAVKYTPAGGRIDVRATRVGEVAELTVSDTGIGISAEDLPRVWDRLFRGDASRSERGFGLGLALVKAIVESHGGTAEVTSTPGAGSVFRVTLPTPSPDERREKTTPAAS
jgi:signal transduction histidine kinase